jgi:hypothetical protein
MLLRSGDLSAAGVEHIALEIESMGKTEKRELVSRLAVLLLHLLKWQFQPDRRGNSWRLSIANARDQLSDHLSDTPSLMARMSEALATSYRYARRDASRETELDETPFPAICPWPFDQITGEGFWPAG